MVTLGFTRTWPNLSEEYLQSLFKSSERNRERKREMGNGETREYMLRMHA